MNIDKGWELVPRKTRITKVPAVTLSRVGVITFNYSCIQKYQIEKFNYVHIYHNPQQKQLGFLFIPLFEDDAMTVGKYTSSSVTISARVLLNELGFYRVKTQSFEASKYSDMVVINYEKPKER